MTITFDFVQDFRKYRKFVTYLTKIDEAMGKLPLKFYAGDMLDCFVIEKKGDVVKVLMTNNADELQARFIEDAQADTFLTIPEDVAYMYNLAKHELIYNYDTKELENEWNWSTYPETFWMQEDEKYDHGLMIGADGTICRMYLSNKRLTALLVALQETETDFPDMFGKGDKSKVTLHEAGVSTVMSIIARQYGQPEPKMDDIKMAISCGLVNTSEKDYAEYDFKALIDTFELKGNEDDLWEDTWGVAVDEAMARDEGAHRGTETTLGSILPSGNLTAKDNSYGFQICLSEMADLEEVPETSRPIYVHMDIPIHGVHYMMIEADQTLAIFYDNLIIRSEDILQHLENLPQSQISFNGDYTPVNENDGYVDELTDEEYAALDRSGTIAVDRFADKLSQSTLPRSYKADSDEELGKSGGRTQ